MGVDWAECEDVGRLLGVKTVLNDFIAYRYNCMYCSFMFKPLIELSVSESWAFCLPRAC